MKSDRFLDYRGNKSSMRLAFITAVYACLFGAVPGCLLLAGLDIVKNQGNNVLAIAGMIAAYAAYAFTAFRGKVDQAKEELKKDEQEKPEA